MRIRPALLALGLCALPANATVVTAPVNADDAQLALKIVAGLAPSASADVQKAEVAAPAAARDGRMDLRDVVYLLRASRGIPMPANAGAAFLSLDDLVSLHEDSDRTYVLARAFRFAGTLVDESGTPVSGFVELTGSNGNQAGLSQFGKEGRFAFGAKGDTYRATVGRHVQVKDPVTGKTSSLTVTEDAGPVTVGSDTEARLPPPKVPELGSVEGDFAQEGFVPQFLSVGVREPGGAWSNASTNFTGGHYHVQCPAGTATFSIHGRWPGNDSAFVYVDMAEPVAVRAGETTRHDIALPPLVRVEGTVFTGGVPVLEVHYRTPFEQDSTRPRYACGLTQNDAVDYTRYAVAVPPGHYEVTIQLQRDPANPGLRRFFRDEADVPEGGGRRDFHLPDIGSMRRFSGRVVDPSGHPLANARLIVLMDPWNEGKGYMIDSWVNTDAGGAFETRLPAGSYRVMVEPPSLVEPAH